MPDFEKEMSLCFRHLQALLHLGSPAPGRTPASAWDLGNVEKISFGQLEVKRTT